MGNCSGRSPHRLWRARQASLFVGTLALLICLVTFATGQAQLNNQRLSKASDPVPTQMKPVDATEQQPLAPASPTSPTTPAVSSGRTDLSAAIQQPTTRPSAISSPICNTTAATRAKLTYEKQMAVEDSRDSSALNQLRMSELVQLILNPSVYTMNINNEKALHEANVAKLASTLHAALSRAHCE